ncbi:MAG: hypothetical protein M3033_03235 [Acidobacteriota bacterium]|nr:hypothetical protein [Acidobacteriota bacterium]
MDVYHKVLIKLHEATGGKDSQIIDFKDLVKGAGFLGNYEDIIQFLSSQGWIAETTKENFVRITHWGVKEAKKSSSGAPEDATHEVKKEANRAVSQTKELLIILEEFAAEPTKESVEQVKKKIAVLNSSIEKLNSGLQ